MNATLTVYHYLPRWLGLAMVLGSFQCHGVLLLLHIEAEGEVGIP